MVEAKPVLHVGPDTTPWYPANETAKRCGYSNYYKAVATHVLPGHVKSLSKLLRLGVSGGVKKLNQNDLKYRYIDAQGVKALVSRSRKPESVAMAEELGIDVSDFKAVYHEPKTIKQLKAAFQGILMQEQFAVGMYRIDLYFPDHKLAVECDEHNHIDRDPQVEHIRETFITRQLDCTWVRYNPDIRNFDILTIVNQVLRVIMATK